MPGPYLNSGPFRSTIRDAHVIGPLEELGVWRFEAGKVLRYVKAGALIPAGEAVRFDTSVAGTSAALLGNQVLQASGATDVFAGIAEVTLPNLSFGWITMYGPATGRVVSATIPGSPLGPSTLTGVLDIRNSSHFNAVAVALQSGLSAGSAVFISVL
jgi:hypothetical protein